MRRIQAGLLTAVMLASTLGATAISSAAPRTTTGVLASRQRPVDPPRARPDDLTRALESGRLDRAEYALERATSLFDLRSVRARFGDVERPDAHDATPILRELVLQEDELSGSDKRRADRILARPSDGAADPEGDGWRTDATERRCLANLDGDPGLDVCLNWVTETSDQTATTFINDAVSVVETVWNREIEQLGYRKPQSDLNSENHGFGRALDIYFADIGDDGLYGYCTTDEPNADEKRTVSAYCVLDNDYDPGQYDAPPPEVNGLDALKVTLAHEFFHAVQFNYDWREALFLMEGTAVWMEDQVYDDIDAAYAFLFDSILHQPEVPLTAFQDGDDGQNFEYGAFVFFTQLAEAYGNGPGDDDPKIIRKVWNKADGRKKGLAAVSAAVGSRGYQGPSTPFRDYFAEWGAASFYYDVFYDEGWDGDNTCDSPTESYWDALHCLYPPFDAVFAMGPGESTGTRSMNMKRHSNRYVVIIPPGSSGPPEPEMTVRVDLPRRRRGGEASLLLLPNTFIPEMLRFDLNRAGNGRRTIPLDVSYVEMVLVLTNSGRHNKEVFKYEVEVSS